MPRKLTPEEYREFHEDPEADNQAAEMMAQATCHTCGEPVLKEEAAQEDKLFFHTYCRPDLVQCVWCGEWFQTSEAYHKACLELAQKEKV